MCIAIGHSAKGAGSFVATDTRVMCQDGTYEDTGGKIVSTGLGWATGAGLAYGPFHVSLRALRDAGPIPLYTDKANRIHPSCDVIARAEEIVSDALTAHGLDPALDGNHVLVIEPGYHVVLVKSGKADEFGYAACLPLDLEDEQVTRSDAMLQSICEAGEGLAARVRAAARHFEKAHRASKAMSGVMEVGYVLSPSVRGFLRGDAEEIANADPSEILERFQAEPSPMLPQDALKRAPLAAISGKVTTSSITAAAITPAESQARSRCKVYRTTAQTLTNNIPTDMTFDAESFDVGGLHDTATFNHRITIPTGGDTGAWFFTFQCTFVGNATGVRIVYIYDQTAVAIALVLGPPAGTTDMTMQVTAMVNAPAVGDYFYARALQNSGGNLNVNAGVTATYFSAQHLW